MSTKQEDKECHGCGCDRRVVSEPSCSCAPSDLRVISKALIGIFWALCARNKPYPLIQRSASLNLDKAKCTPAGKYYSILQQLWPLLWLHLRGFHRQRTLTSHVLLVAAPSIFAMQTSLLFQEWARLFYIHNNS